MSGYKDIKIFFSISKILSISGTICHTVTWGCWAHRPRSSLLVLNPLGRYALLRDCLDGLSSWVSAAFCCCSGLALVWSLLWTAGRSWWAVLTSSYRNTSDLEMINMISFNYAFSLSLVFCLDSASDASVFDGPGAEPAGPAATD